LDIDGDDDRLQGAGEGEGHVDGHVCVLKDETGEENRRTE